jgi:hypothetical protein
MRRFSSDTSWRSPVWRPRTAMSKRSRAISVRMPVVSRYSPTERLSHSAAFGAVQGASRGTSLDIRSIFHWARAIVSTANGLIFGMSPL